MFQEAITVAVKEKIRIRLKGYDHQLVDQSAEIEKVTLTHAYIDGMQPNDAIEIEYSVMAWRGNVTNMSVNLAPSTPCTTQLRRFVPNSLTITTDGGVLW